MSAAPVAEYFRELHMCSGVGVPETSGYPALSNLLNAVGDTLKPKIAAVIHPANAGAGIPDGGLYSARELRKHGADSPSLLDMKPERGVVEVKPLSQDLSAFESSPQVRGYLETYGQILLTNYRALALWSWREGKPVRGEHLSLAASEREFWSKVHVWRAAADHPDHERLWQFLRRALLSTARIATPQDLAAFLASYAREARARVEIAPMGTLEPVKHALSEALGVRFEGDKGLHFFQSTLIQTLFYGIFSAWVLWHESAPAPGRRFEWKSAVDHLGLPILRSLFHQVAYPANIRALDLEEVLDWAEDCLARVDRAGFFARYDMGDAVQYFYEPFLAEFDPELRKQFGVWYTPPEIVRYMVGRVDRALRENFHLPDGLADPGVVVLDPCCGTGAYLVETLKLIRRRLVDAYGESQAGLKIKEAARRRLYGFELLPAPYVVSHLQIDLMLARWGAALDHERDERAGVFLTNALTGWVPVKSPKDLPFSEFSDERDAADHVKQQEHILVILGNPPYDGYAGMAVEEERSLSEAYRDTKAAPAPQGQGLNDLYVRFFRMAERRIAEGVPDSDDPKPGPPRPDAKGIVCFISNYSWLDGLSHTGMRERFLEAFDSIEIDCLNGDKYKTGKKTPDGKPDPSVFSTPQNPEGIQVGTAIALLERWPGHADQPPPGDGFHPRAKIGFRHWWGKNKRADVEASLDAPVPPAPLSPAVKLGLPFVPGGALIAYSGWISVKELLAYSSYGILTNRDDALVSIDLPPLEERMKSYFNPKVALAEIAKNCAALAKKTGEFDPVAVRSHLLLRGCESGEITRIAYRPFDVRWLYWHPETKLLERKREDFRPHLFSGNVVVSIVQQNRKGFSEPLVTTCFPSHHLIERGANYFPLYLKSEAHAEGRHPDLFTPVASGPQPNLTDFAKSYLAGLEAGPEDLFFHIVAILHAPLYRADNAGALRQDWPRVPLPADAATLRAGAALGRQLAALLDPETPVPGVTTLQVREDLKGLGELVIPERSAGVPPAFSDDAGKMPTLPSPDRDPLAVAARWGYIQEAKNGDIVMPGPGLVRAGTRGGGFLDIHLNPSTRWKDVPEPVWRYTLGGYQVLKKWLSYREAAVLGRPLTSDEALAFTHNVRRIAAILALHPQLDAHYSACAASPFFNAA